MVKKKLDKLLVILGVLIFIISMIGFWGTLEKKKAKDNQLKVIANVIESPNDCAIITSRGGYCKLEYNGKVYVKKAGNKFCHLVSKKETVVVLTNENRDKIFFIGSYNSNDFVFSGVLLILSILAIVKGLKGKTRKT
jgi:hypothetical protein